MCSALSDVELVKAAQAGDAGCLGLLIERHRAGMRAEALRVAGYGVEAEDAVQEAAVAALSGIAGLRDPAAAGAWLRAIVRNSCLMELRAARASPFAEPEQLPLPSVPSPEEILDRRVLHDWIWRAVDELSEPLRLVVLLRHFTEVSSYEQIAALCGVPVGTVRSRLNEARRLLRGALAATAAADHGDAGALAGERRAEAVEMLRMAEAGAFAAALAGRWSAQLELTVPDGRVIRSRDLLVSIMEGDLRAGVRQRIVEVVAGRDITILEAELVSPPDDPHHCPPSLVWLQTMRRGRVERLRLFHPR